MRRERKQTEIGKRIAKAAEVSCKRVYIPQQNYERLSQEYLKRFQCEIKGIDNFKQIEGDIFYKTGETNDEKRDSL